MIFHLTPPLPPKAPGAFRSSLGRRWSRDRILPGPSLFESLAQDQDLSLFFSVHLMSADTFRSCAAIKTTLSTNVAVQSSYLIRFGWASPWSNLTRSALKQRDQWTRSNFLRLRSVKFVREVWTPSNIIVLAGGRLHGRSHVVWMELLGRMPHQNLRLIRILSESGQHCLDLSPIGNYNRGWGPSPSSYVHMFCNLHRKLTCCSCPQDVSPAHSPRDHSFWLGSKLCRSEPHRKL